MKIAVPSKKLMKRGFGLCCIFVVVIAAYGWRRPSLPPGIELPSGAHMAYSVRYLNPTMSGAALYYRIESPQSQSESARNFCRNSALTVKPVSSLRRQNIFPFPPPPSSTSDKVTMFQITDQIFSTEAETLCDCLVWRTTRGSTVEMLVWTNF